MLKRCKCGKNLGSNNKSGLCFSCYHLKFVKERRKRLIKEHKCINCGIKVKPKIIYYKRCDKCLEKNR